MSALPLLQFLPGDGRQLLKPFAATDLGAAVVAALATAQKHREFIELVGPQALTLRAYLLAWRAWFGSSKPVIVQTPMRLVNLAVTLGELHGRGPLCRVVANLLQRERVGGEHAHARTRALLGRDPLCLDETLRQQPSAPHDLLAARWYSLQFVLLSMLVIVWIASGMVGLSLASSSAAATMPGWSPALVHVCTVVGSSVDLLLGLALLTGRATRLVLQAMLVMIAGYTLAIGAAAPQHWLDPLGGLLKNLPIAAIIIALLIMEPRRR
jgi:uncharacterized membrane protein YphA (DoxX/SURF4 family)